VDQFYFEEGYLEPSYFTVIREADSAVTVTASLSADVIIADATGYYIPDYIAVDYFTGAGVVVEASGEWTASFTQTAQVNKTNDIDLFAFSEAAIAVQIEVTRTTNIAVTAVFDIATDGRRFRDITAAEESLFDFNAVIERSRATSIDVQAAFSFACTTTIISPAIQGDANLESLSALAATANRIQQGSSSLSSTTELSAIISHIEGADIVADGFAELSAELTNVSKESSVALNSSSTMSVSGGFKLQYSAELNAYSSITTSRYFGTGRPRTPVVTTTPTTLSDMLTTAQSKFGSHSITYHNNGFNTVSQITASSPYSRPGANESWVYEIFYYYTSSFNLTNIINLGFSGTGFFSCSANGRRINLTTYKVGVTNTVEGTVNLLNANTWNHILIVYHNGRISAYANGTRSNTIDLSALTSTNWNSNTFTLTAAVREFTYFDEISLFKGTNLGYDPTLTSITVPVSSRSNNDNAQLIWHLDGNANDDIKITQTGAAALISNAIINATLTGPQRGSANLQSTASLTATISHIESIEIQAFTNASLNANIDKIKNAEAVSNLETQLSALGNIVSSNSAELASEFNQTSDTDRIRDNEITTDSVASQLSVVAKIADFFVNADVVAEIIVDAVKTTDAISSKSAITSVSISAVKSADYSAAIATVASIAISTDRIRNNAIALSSTLSVDALVNVQRDGEAELVSEFSTEITTQGIIDIIALVMSSGTLAFTPTITRTVAVDLDSEFTQTTETFDSLSQQGSADLNSEFAQTVDNQRIRYASVTTESIASNLAVVAVITNTGITLTTTANLSAEGRKFSGITENLSAESNLSTTGTRIQEISETVESEFTVLVNARKDTDTAADVIIQSNLTAVAVKGTEILLQAFTNAAMTTIAGRIRDISSAVDIIVSQTAQADRLRDAVISTEAIAVQMIVAGKKVETITTAPVISTLTVSANVLHLDEYVYVIPGEGRSYTINGETRLRKIAGESREFTIRR
jgi:hypothetical protein